MKKFKKKYNSKIRKRKQKKLINKVKKLSIAELLIDKNVVSTHKEEKNNNNIEKFTFLKFFIMQVIISFYMIFPILIILIKPKTVVYKYKVYKVGEYLTIENNNWYVIKESNSNDNEVILLSETDFDINQDGILDDKDKLDFKSIEKLFNSDIKKQFSNKKIHNIRLLKSEEYISARDKMNFGYDWNEENWLAGKTKGKWWLSTKKYGKIFSVKTNGAYSMDSESDKNFIRLVIEVSKFNLK